MTTKEASDAPIAKSTGVASRNGRKARFSLRYRPGATNSHIWLAINGNASMKAANSATFTSTKNAPYRLVEKSRPWPGTHAPARRRQRITTTSAAKQKKQTARREG